MTIEITTANDAAENTASEIATPHIAKASPSLQEYDRILAFFSGGKDSIACVLHLIELGVPREKIELHHHLVDGEEGAEHFMDWPVTTAYCRAFARDLGLKISFSWKSGGFKGEMLRTNQPTAPSVVPIDGAGFKSVGGNGKLGTRNKFPQVSSSLTTRWCSSYLKIMLGDALINNSPRFLSGKTLVVTGERAEESASRAKYKVFEPHRTDRRNGARVQRWVDHWRPVHGWEEEEVWATIKRFSIDPHVAYKLGFSRVSCMKCIFAGKNQWASVKKIDGAGFQEIAWYERKFGYTIHRTLSIVEQASLGIPYDMDPLLMQLAMSREYNDSVIVDNWQYPAGAFRENCGPT